MRTHFRGILEWMHEGNPLSTSSNDACKMYDAALSQIVGWYNDPNLGGLDQTFKLMEREDSDFVMGRCLKICSLLADTGRHPKNDPYLRCQLLTLNRLSQEGAKRLSQRERLHVKAVNEWADGNMKAAANVWERILLDNPTDMHAIRFSQDVYFFTGQQMRLRDSIARVLPFWQSSSIPLKNYLHGMYAFGLEETHFYEKARSEARLALDRNANDGWATHALGHVHEMLGEAEAGIRMYEQSEPNWSRCDMLSCHNYWHWGLYLLEQNQFDQAFELYREHIERQALAGDGVFNFVDACSFLYRLELLENKRRPEAWTRMFDRVECHLDDHVYGFNETHYMMACIGAEKPQCAHKLLHDLNPNEQTYPVTRDLLTGMQAFEQRDYSSATESLSRGQNDWVTLGGSDAQRDIFHQLLVVSAIRSPDEIHRRLAERLIVERSQFREKSGINQLLVEQLNMRND